MKVIRIIKEQKEYNGTPYTSFRIFGADGNVNKVITCTGRIPVFALDNEGTVIYDYKLSDTPIKPGDTITPWFDNNNRVETIQIYIE